MTSAGHVSLALIKHISALHTCTHGKQYLVNAS